MKSQIYFSPEGDAIAYAMHLDRMFFEKNPDKARYVRFEIPGEKFGLFVPLSVVEVTQLDPGTRIRVFVQPPDTKWGKIEDETAPVDPCDSRRMKKIALNIFEAGRGCLLEEIST